ncbi:hypothetical protein GMJAKD_15340 [Candidatus Electrothrix aarhusensis]
MPPTQGEVILYQTEDGQTGIDVQLKDETVWLTLNQIAELFGRDKSVISRHLRNIFQSEELKRSAVVANNATTAADGKTYQVDYYNLDAIISVGYRVNSKRGTQFRIWATTVLKQHLVQGYTLHQKRLAEKGAAEIRQVLDLLSNSLESHDLEKRIDAFENTCGSWNRSESTEETVHTARSEFRKSMGRYQR